MRAYRLSQIFPKVQNRFGTNPHFGNIATEPPGVGCGNRFTRGVFPDIGSAIKNFATFNLCRKRA
jgi:hypothetical protein